MSCRFPAASLLCAALLCASLLCGGYAVANEDANFADLSFFPRESPHAIPKLSFSSHTIAVHVENGGSADQKVTATLQGVFDRKNWALVGPHRLLIVSRGRTEAKAAFSAEIPLTGRKTVVRLLAVGPDYRQIERETVVIDYPQFVRGSQAATEIPALGENWDVGLGITSISYSQSGLSDFSEIALTPKILYQQPLGENWDLGASVFATALPLSSNMYGVAAYFLGVNARIGYRLPFVSSPWTLGLAAGLYYTTMFTSGLSFGFENMFGPQIFPVLRRDLSHGNSVAAYFKYSPVTTGSSSGFSSHELATGLSYTHLLPGGHSLSGTLDYSDLQVNLTDASASSSNVTLGAAFGF